MLLIAACAVMALLIAYAASVALPQCSANSTACAAWAQALATVLAVVVTYFLASADSRRMKEHQVLMSTPRLAFDHLVQHEEPQALVTIENVGLGPAIIDRMEVTFDGNQVQPGFGMWDNLLPELVLPNGVKSGGMHLGKNQILAPGASETLFRWCAADPEFRLPPQVIGKQLERIGFTIEYRSIYGRRGTASTDSSKDRDIEIGEEC